MSERLASIINYRYQQGRIRRRWMMVLKSVRLPLNDLEGVHKKRSPDLFGLHARRARLSSAESSSQTLDSKRECQSCH